MASHRLAREVRRAPEARGGDEATAALFFPLVAGQGTTSQFLALLHRLIGERAPLDAPVAAVVEEGAATAAAGVAAADGRQTHRDRRGRDGVPAPDGAGAARLTPSSGARRGAHRRLGSRLSRMEAEVVTELAPLLRRRAVASPPMRSDENLSFRMPSPLVAAERCRAGQSSPAEFAGAFSGFARAYSARQRQAASPAVSAAAIHGS